MPVINNKLWEHFVKDKNTRTAVCNYCSNTLSYRSTITNLKMHLKLKHIKAYEVLIASTVKTVKKTDTENANTTHRSQRSNSVLWDHFNRDPDTKTAECNYCERTLSYRTTITNLKHHLRLKHATVFKNIPALSQTKAKSIYESGWSFKNTTYRSIWEYFDKDPSTKTAECRDCLKSLSYRTTITNLKIHLKMKHIDLYNELLSPPGDGVRKKTKESDTSDSDSELSEQYKFEADESEKDLSEQYKSEQEQSDHNQSEHSADEDAEELLKLSGVWNFFEEEAGRKACCVVCRTSVGNEYEELKAHLKDSHPKLLLQIMQENDRTSDAGSNNADDDNTYTEIVYLEQEPTEETTPKPREKPKYTPKITPKFAKKRERLNSSSDETPLKRKKDDENDELGTFIKYITCLLKKLPQDVFSKVQVDIINTILRANTTPSTSTAVDSPRIILNNELPKCTVPNLITVNEIQPIDSGVLGHNYTITVASKDNEIENS